MTDVICGRLNINLTIEFPTKETIKTQLVGCFFAVTYYIIIYNFIITIIIFC